MAIAPLVNLNGTDAETLIEQQKDIVEAADQLLRALHHAMPHGRDYHMLSGPENWTELARREHQARIACVQQIIKDAHDIAASVMEQRRR
jgi:hypothetical protein